MLCEKVSARIRHAGLKCGMVTLKIRLADFSTFTRSAKLEYSTNFIEVLYGSAKKLYKGFNTKGMKVRLVGVKTFNFCPAGFRDSLFKESGFVAREARHKALDRIKKRFGDSSIFIAGSRI